MLAFYDICGYRAGLGGYTCAQKTDGTLRCWGSNASGAAPALSITPATLPNATFGAAYTQNLTVSGTLGATAPYTVSVVSGALPAGLTLNADGAWSGAPTAGGTFNFTVRAMDENTIATTLEYALTVPANTTTTLTSTPNPSIYNQSVTLTATVTSAIGGTVAFKADGTVIAGCGAQPLSSGQATCVTTALTVGAHTLTAEYSGAGSYNAGKSANLTHTVTIVGTATTLATASNPSALNQSVTLTATVTSGSATPTGTVTFAADGLVISGCSVQPLSSGQATCATTALTVGAHALTATYRGSANYDISASGFSIQTVNPPSGTTTTLASAPNPSSYNQSVTITATVTSSGGTPTGTVAFKDGGTVITGCGAKALTSGQATCATTALTLGAHSLSAEYSGVPGYLAGASATYSHMVNQAGTTTTVTSTPNPSTYNQSVTITATVASAGGAPTGTVAFKNGGTVITGCGAQTLTSGQATCTTTALALGARTLAAAYSGATNYAAGASSNYSHMVNQAGTTTTVTSTPNPSTYNQSVTITATVASAGGAPTGTVAFKDGGTVITGCGAQTVTSGQATCTTTALALGARTLAATYSGATNYAAGASSNYSHMVNQAGTTTTVTSTPNPTTYNQSVTITATVSSTAGTPTGTVAFMDGGTAITGCGAQTLTSGQATCTTTALALGVRTLAATYSGATNYAAGASSNYSHTVNQAGTTTTVTSTPNPSTYNQSVIITATVASAGGAPTGAVAFKDGGTVITGCGAQTLTSGQATCTTTALTFGVRILAATYSGATNYAAGTSSNYSHTINQADTTTTVTSTPNPSTYNQSVTITATVASAGGAPTGAVAFKDGGTVITGCSAQTLTSGQATCTTTALALGAHTLAATYSGAINYAVSTSSNYSQTILPTYTVSYDGNGATSGGVPNDATAYISDVTVTVLANSGSLTRTGYTLAGWNSAADGSGAFYAAGGSASFTMGSANVTLYAQWITSAPPFSEWARSFGLVGASAYIYATTTDSSGNTYVAGYFGGVTLSLGGVTLSRIGANDTFVAKLDAAGTVLWARNVGGGGANTYSFGIAVDGSGNVYLTGTTNANLTSPPLTKIGGVGSTDTFVLKLGGADGAFSWVKNFGGSGLMSTIGRGITADDSGGVYLTGESSGNLTTPPLTKIGNTDVVAIKLSSSDGAIIWAKNYGGSGATAAGYGTTVDGSGNVYLVGSTNADLTTPPLTKIGNNDAFAIKLSRIDGSIIWVRNYGGSGATAYLYSVAVDGFDNPYLAGYLLGGSLTTPPLTQIGINDAIAIKLGGSDGAIIWAKNFGGGGAGTVGRSIKVDGSGNASLLGEFNSADLTTPPLARIGAKTVYAIRLDSSGATTWAGNFGGAGASAYGRSLAADSSGNLYLGGSFSANSLTNPPLTKTGANDAYIFAVKPGYHVTYDGNGATNGAAPADGNHYLTGDSVMVAANSGGLAGTNYTFIGWNTAADGTGTAYAAGGANFIMGTGNVTLYAAWTINRYTVTYNANNAISGTAPSDQIKTHGADLTLAANTGALTRVGYTFNGWNTAADSSGVYYAAGGNYTDNAAAALYAAWTINRYTVATPVASHGQVSCDSPVVRGGSSTCTISADSGYQLATLRDNDADVLASVTGNRYVITSISANHTVTATFIDPKPPTLHLSTLSNGSVTRDATLNIAGSVTSGNGIKSLIVNGVPVVVAEDGSFSTVYNLATGSNSITTTATDTIELFTSDTRTITLDQTAPVLNITAPADNSAVNAPLITVTGSVDDNTAVVDIYLNQSATPQAAQMTDLNFTADLSLAPGLNTIEVKAKDPASNVSSVKRSVTYDDQQPNLAVTFPANDITTDQATLTVTGAASDLLTAVSVTITMDGHTYPQYLIGTGFSQELTFTTAKTYVITVKAVNATGTATTAIRNVIYQPVASITVQSSPAGRSITVDGTTYTAPQSFTWIAGSSHTLAVLSPQTGSIGTRYPFASWSDGGTQSHNVTAPATVATYTADFGIQYLLTTNLATPGSGTVQPASGSWYVANSTPGIIATAATGYSFASWSGPVANPASAATSMLPLTGPATATANMTPVSTTMSAAVTAKTGAYSGIRNWTIALRNTGAATASAAKIDNISFSANTGATCRPVVTSALPQAYGDIAQGNTVSRTININFVGCAKLTKFNLAISYSANSGITTGITNLTGEVQ